MLNNKYKLGSKWTAVLMLFSMMIFQMVSAATIYLVRHAEKQVGDNPALTVQGLKRAERIAQILKHANIKTVFSTDYLRTQQTAEPIANVHNLKVKLYDAEKPEEFTKQIIENNENTVIVGHSNTIPDLTELLSKVTIETMSEAEFGLIYQVILVEKKPKKRSKNNPKNSPNNKQLNRQFNSPTLRVLSSDEKSD